MGYKKEPPRLTGSEETIPDITASETPTSKTLRLPTPEPVLVPHPDQFELIETGLLVKARNRQTRETRRARAGERYGMSNGGSDRATEATAALAAASILISFRDNLANADLAVVSPHSIPSRITNNHALSSSYTTTTAAQNSPIRPPSFPKLDSRIASSNSTASPTPPVSDDDSQPTEPRKMVKKMRTVKAAALHSVSAQRRIDAQAVKDNEGVDTSAGDADFQASLQYTWYRRKEKQRRSMTSGRTTKIRAVRRKHRPSATVPLDIPAEVNTATKTGARPADAPAVILATNSASDASLRPSAADRATASLLAELQAGAGMISTATMSTTAEQFSQSAAATAPAPAPRTSPSQRQSSPATPFVSSSAEPASRAQVRAQFLREWPVKYVLPSFMLTNPHSIKQRTRLEAERNRQRILAGLRSIRSSSTLRPWVEYADRESVRRQYMTAMQQATHKHVSRKIEEDNSEVEKRQEKKSKIKAVDLKEDENRKRRGNVGDEEEDEENDGGRAKRKRLVKTI